MVFDWMMMVVSPFLTLLEVVVIVRVTLHEVSTVAAPIIIRAIAAPMIFKIKAFITDGLIFPFNRKRGGTLPFAAVRQRSLQLPEASFHSPNARLHTSMFDNMLPPYKKLASLTRKRSLHSLPKTHAADMSDIRRE